MEFKGSEGAQTLSLACLFPVLIPKFNISHNFFTLKKIKQLLSWHHQGLKFNENYRIDSQNVKAQAVILATSQHPDVRIIFLSFSFKHI